MWRGRSSRRVPEERAASLETVRAAIEGLTEADRLRLAAFAAWRVRGLGRRACGRTHEDLLNEAVVATLDGTRSWNHDRVDFMGYLIGAMRSISDNWGRRFKEAEPVLEADLGRDDASQSVLDRAPAVRLSPEEEVEVKQQQEAVRRLFADDPIVTLIILEIEEGAKFSEIREKHGLAENELLAALKRARRRIARQTEKVFHV
jgi:DNA-directed RNA polymerase specialized sigma24 family protein